MILMENVTQYDQLLS